jgi:hypothetical protein
MISNVVKSLAQSARCHPERRQAGSAAIRVKATLPQGKCGQVLGTSSVILPVSCERDPGRAPTALISCRVACCIGVRVLLCTMAK